MRIGHVEILLPMKMKLKLNTMKTLPDRFHVPRAIAVRQMGRVHEGASSNGLVCLFVQTAYTENDIVCYNELTFRVSIVDCSPALGPSSKTHKFMIGKRIIASSL